MARTYSRHGLHPLRRRVMVEGLVSLDRRSVAARALLDWRAELIAALGGEQTVTPQQTALIELATRTRLYVDHLDVFLMAQRSLVNVKREDYAPRAARAPAACRFAGPNPGSTRPGAEDADHGPHPCTSRSPRRS